MRRYTANWAPDFPEEIVALILGGLDDFDTWDGEREWLWNTVRVSRRWRAAWRAHEVLRCVRIDKDWPALGSRQMEFICGTLEPRPGSAVLHPRTELHVDWENGGVR